MYILPANLSTNTNSFGSKNLKKVAQACTKSYAIDDEIYKLYSRRNLDVKSIAKLIGTTTNFVKERIRDLRL